MTVKKNNGSLCLTMDPFTAEGLFDLNVT